MRRKFPSATRFSSVLLQADNVLRADTVRQTLRLLREVQALSNGTAALWPAQCVRTPFKVRRIK